MSATKNDDGGPAFACPTGHMEGFGRSDDAPGLSKREYAAIHLRVPDSGNEMIDGMIRQRMRDDFAGQALVGFTKLDTAYDYSTGHCDSALGRRAYAVADAMLAARGGEGE